MQGFHKVEIPVCPYLLSISLRSMEKKIIGVLVGGRAASEHPKPLPGNAVQVCTWYSKK
jgi:hypothetical protein